MRVSPAAAAILAIPFVVRLLVIAVEDAMTWRGIGLSGAVVSALVLIGFAAAFSFIAVSRFGGKGLTKS